VDENKRPFSIVVVACVYLAVGVVGFAYHFPELWARHPDAVGIEVTELAALVCGVFLLRRQNWARWLALAWMAFHVALSAFHPLGELAVHVAFLVMFGWVLLGREANRWFSRAGASWLDRPVMPK
jgi:hypothetical protein